MEIRCYRKTLHISYKDHVTNEELCAKIEQAIGPHVDLLTIVKRYKLQWYGHVSRSSGLAKTILQCTVKGERKQDRQRQRWEDNITEWKGLEFAKSQRAVEIWNKLVVKSSVVPQRPLRLKGMRGSKVAKSENTPPIDIRSDKSMAAPTCLGRFSLFHPCTVN